MQHLTVPRARRLGLAVAATIATALASTSLMAQDPAQPSAAPLTPQQIYLKDRANCDAGRTAEDHATCLKEAGAALAERKRHALDNSGTPLANATERCKALPDKDQADCLARIVGPVSTNQRVTTSGSVAGGGVVKETTTTIPGEVIVIVPDPTPTK